MNITLDNISKSYGGKTVFSGFSCVFPENSRVCLMGESGCGKTTLLNIIMGLTSPDGGTAEGIPSLISAVFQEDRLCEPFSAVANIRAVTDNARTEADIVDCLKSLGLEGNEYLPVSTLSGGMRRRVSIARALLAESELVIMDEPFKGLDEANRVRTVEVILSYINNKTLIFATHDVRDAELLNAEILELTSRGS